MAFTTIDVNTSWQDLAIAVEIATSYNLRRRLKGFEEIAVPTKDTRVFDFVLAIQTGLEEMAAGRWIDKAGAISDYQYLTSGSITALTKDEIMALSGMTSAGYWRRVPVDGEKPTDWEDYGDNIYAYGKIEDGDLAGPWLFKDLQLLMEQMTRHVWLTLFTYRTKDVSYGPDVSPIPATPLSWDEWDNGSFSYAQYSIIKRKNSGVIVSCAAIVQAREFAYSIDNDIAELETDRGAFTFVNETGSSAYSDFGAKYEWAQIGASIYSVIEKYAMNGLDKNVGETITTYSGVLAEDTNTLDAIPNEMLPDSDVPDTNTSIVLSLQFMSPIIIIDFTFE